MSNKRKTITIDMKVAALTEVGYRCAVPTCRNILAIDLHHIVEVSEGGGNDLSNLLPLCPTCHALYTRGTISKESIRAWKGMLVALGRAFDMEAVDGLLFLRMLEDLNVRAPIVSGDTVMKYSRLIASELVLYESIFETLGEVRTSGIMGYMLYLTEKGRLLVDAWKSGDRNALKAALGTLPGGN